MSSSVEVAWNGALPLFLKLGTLGVSGVRCWVAVLPLSATLCWPWARGGAYHPLPRPRRFCRRLWLRELITCDSGAVFEPMELDDFSSKAGSTFQQEVKQRSNPKTWWISVPYIVTAGQYWWHERSNMSSLGDLIQLIPLCRISMKNGFYKL